MAEQTTVFPNLEGHRYANMTTFRKSGQGVPTPIWFAEHAGKLYMVTDAGSGKVKRIRNNSAVLLEPCTGRGKTLGPSLPGQARELPEADWPFAKQKLDRKYRLEKVFVDMIIWVNRTLRRPSTSTYLEIVPAAPTSPDTVTA